MGGWRRQRRDSLGDRARAGLADKGIDLRLADKIVGTSAGSFVGAELASGRAPSELRARVIEGAQARAGQSSTPNALPVPDLTKLMEFMMRAPKSEAEALKLRAEIGAYALEAATIPEEACIGFFASVADTPWPACTCRHAERMSSTSTRISTTRAGRTCGRRMVYTFTTRRMIRRGEELTVDYRTYGAEAALKGPVGTKL